MDRKLLWIAIWIAISAGLLFAVSVSGEAQSSKQYAPGQEMHEDVDGAPGYATGQRADN